MSTRYQNILQTIGNTPTVKLNRLAPEHVNLYVKIESFNPMGSVKDRLALGVIEDAEQRGELQPGQTIVEATSGNTGIGLAMVCAQKGYPLVITMAENFSVERRRLMRFLGVIPGAVTPFAAINDTGGKVGVVLDRAMLDREPLNFHPLDNSMTTSVSTQGLLRFLADVDHDPAIATLDDFLRA